MSRSDRAPDHEPFDHEPERGGRDDRDDKGHTERRAGARDGPCNERRDHEHLALCEVHGAGRVVDDHQAQRDERVDRAGREPAHDDVRDGGGGHAPDDMQ